MIKDSLIPFFSKKRPRSILSERLEIGNDLGRDRVKANHVDVPVLTQTLDHLLIEVIGREIIIFRSSVT